MAYRSLYNWFSKFRKSYFPDWIYWYNEFVLKTPKQRAEEEAMRKREAHEAIAILSVISSALRYHSKHDWF